MWMVMGQFSYLELYLVILTYTTIIINMTGETSEYKIYGK